MNGEATTVFRPGLEPAEYATAIVDQARKQELLGSSEAAELEQILHSYPGLEGSGLDEAAGRCFLYTNLQIIEICLQDRRVERRGFVNELVQETLNARYEEASWTLAEINDERRRGTNRARIFGQVKNLPQDPNDPSFFGGCWDMRRGKEARRITFTIGARGVSETLEVRDLGETPDPTLVAALLEARGDRSWERQVVVDSDLGRWIAHLAGTRQIGQIRGQIPLGVLGEAVKRELERAGLGYYLLGPSRRDRPEKPWHTGRFLDRKDGEFEFVWNGFVCRRTDRKLGEATVRVRMEAEILADQSVADS